MSPKSILLNSNHKQVAILGDAHAGVRDGNKVMMEHQLKFLEEIFIPHLISNDINIVIQTGDIFDVRKYTNTEVLAEWKRRFFDVLKKHNIQLVVYVGNHDMFYKNKISPNSVTENLHHYTNVHIIEEPMEISIDGTDMLMVPWICKENETECLDSIRNSSSKVCFGHFEMVGAKMESGTCKDGLPLSTFNRYDLCISGHFHTTGQYENVRYVGTPYEMTWGDYGVPKGFWIMSTGDLSLSFIENPNKIFHKITYNEDRDMSLMVDGVDYRNQYVKVIIEHREDYEKFESWLMRLENSGVMSLSVVEPFTERDEESMVASDGTIQVLSTRDLIREYVKQVYPEREEPLTKMMLSLHSNAQRIFGSD